MVSIRIKTIYIITNIDDINNIAMKISDVIYIYISIIKLALLIAINFGTTLRFVVRWVETYY